jgi:hypothetical protein
MTSPHWVNNYITIKCPDHKAYRSTVFNSGRILVPILATYRARGDAAVFILPSMPDGLQSHPKTDARDQGKIQENRKR